MPALIKVKETGQINQHLYMETIQSCMTLTDMRLTEYMGLKEKGATTELSI